MYNDITAIILAGGKSTRMGVNKSLLKIGGFTIIERVVNLLNPLFSKIMLITNNPEEYSFLELDKFGDIYTSVGPLAGIHSGLVHSKTEKNFIISCDIPLMTRELISYIIEYPTDKSIIIGKADNYVQQLCGVYNREVLPLTEQIIKENIVSEERNSDQKKRGCKVLELIKLADAQIINIEQEYKNYIPGTYHNMNNPSEYEYLLKKLATAD